MQTLDFAEALEQYLDDPYQYQFMTQGFSSVVNIIQLAMRIVMIIGMWLMFDKAGENGWGSIIPFYRGYLLFKTAGIRNWFWGTLVASLVYGVCLTVSMIYFFAYFVIAAFGGASQMDDSATKFMAILFFLGSIAGLYCFIVTIFRGIKMAKAFNLSGGWAVGIILLPWLFYMIMGCSKNIHHWKYPNGVPKPQVGGQPGMNGQPGYQQNPYGQNQYSQNTYAQNQYQQNVYAQNPYQQNQYSQNTYAQNTYAQNTAQADQAAPLNPYANNPYMQNAQAQAQAPAQPSQPAQSPYASTPDSSQNPYQNPPKQEVWNTIYDDSKNNL